MAQRIDDLQYKGLKLIQDTDEFCFGCDAVELANFADVKAGSLAADPHFNLTRSEISTPQTTNTSLL